ncbi:hypothetical protein MHM88_14260 [Epibacterium sp. MM17-32]|uniref:hypothetical protein n=1 Tax=Epibacterium sp. MM17-32 TaxID=2917734 RepID=UPI001EF4786D|nr:hypothetical protein [Epibacterium sp. MM17-32]MCG7628971.1 hypothetical protein [Epibacterium sp. MM17-32]
MTNYIDQATRTESIDLFKVDSPRLLHAAIGACTEVGELLLANEGDVTNVKEEMGDICWYVAIACSELGIWFEDLLVLADEERAEDDPFKALLGGAGDALDVVKRALFYGVELDEAKFGRHFGTMLLALQIMARDEGWDLTELQEANIAKLSRRYPEKFTTEAAVNRDTAAELAAVGV